MRNLIFLTLTIVLSYSTLQAAPKNIILLIGDGMGEAEISLARNYEFDGGGGLFLDTMDFRGSAIVNALLDSDPNKLAFVGDSASGGTVLATGQRTAVRRVSTTAKFGVPIKTIAEQAKEKGFSVGIVTTAEITDATPASFGSHTNNRYCLKAGDNACNGDTPIFEQYFDTDYDVFLGGGQRHLSGNYGNSTIGQAVKDNGYTLIQNARELSKDALSTSDKNAKLWGVFSEEHFPREWQGYQGIYAEKMAIDDNNMAIFPPAKSCEANPAYAGKPTLQAMTERALRELDAKNGADANGFFLMIEGASIDKSSHDADPCGVIGELLSFDRTAQMAVEYARNHEGTIVIVTADHGGATQIIHHPYYERYKRISQNVPGLFKMLLTKGGNEMLAYYGGNNITKQTNPGDLTDQISPGGLEDQPHTGINVPVYSYGLADDNILRGTIKQTEIYGVMANHLFD